MVYKWLRPDGRSHRFSRGAEQSTRIVREKQAGALDKI
jgi:hypothetical protein